MKRSVFSFLIGIACWAGLAACTSSKVYTSQVCNVCLSPFDGILLLPLAWEPSFRQLSVAQQNQLERQILEDLRSRGFAKVELYDQLDYELLKADIRDLNDSIQLSKIHMELGYPYLLALALGPSREGTGERYYRRTDQDPLRPDPTLEAVPDLSVETTLRVSLVETLTGSVVSDQTVVASNPGFQLPVGKGDTMDWSSSLIQVVRSGTAKGVKAMIKDCGC